MKMIKTLKVMILISLASLAGSYLSNTAQATVEVFTVINTNDSGPGSLRQAISRANAHPGFDIITFNIPGAGVHTIRPLTPLPLITDRVVIDGTTQPGFGGVPLIEVSGEICNPAPPPALPITNGLVIIGNASSGSTVRGLVINRFTLTIPDPDSPGEFIGGNGISLQSSGGNVIEGNFLGTDVTGTVSLGNFRGVGIDNGSSNNVIRSNLLSGNTLGVGIRNSSNNIVQGNLIGTAVNGLDSLGNFLGVLLNKASANTIGGTTPEARNVISGNSGPGVRIIGSNAAGNQVRGNFIGTDITGAAPLGNGLSGVAISDGASGNIIGGTASGAGNTIAFNNGAGVSVFSTSSAGNSIRRNSVFSNGGLGIDLGEIGPNPNDPCDSDSGPNNLQNFPALTSTASDGGNIVIEGMLNSAPDTTVELEFFSNTSFNPFEGQTFIGSIEVTTGSEPNCSAGFTAIFPAPVPAGQLITATATDPNGNTSEFSVFSTPGAKVTGGGSIRLAEGKATFGFEALTTGAGNLQSNVTYQDHLTGQMIKSTVVTAVVVNPARTHARIFGKAAINGAGSFAFVVDVDDLGEPGAGVDKFHIRLSNGYNVGGTLMNGGNIQIHK